MKRYKIFASTFLIAVSISFISHTKQAFASSHGHESKKRSTAAQEMMDSAINFLASIEGVYTGSAKFHIKDEERKNFHFFPIPRRGISWKEMNTAQQSLAYALLSTALSAKGFLKATTIMSLGQILRDLDPEGGNVYRDSDQYYVTIFSDPDPVKPWGWRIEGFHISVNITIVNGKIASTPFFFGAIPAIVENGPRKGLEVLHQEENIARELAESLTREQRKSAIFELPVFEDTVGGLLTGNTRKLEPEKPRGIPYTDLTTGQQTLLMSLIKVHAYNRRDEFAKHDLAKIKEHGINNLHFSWAGGTKPGEPHHYMIQGPTFLIELDNTQDDANHVHFIWRDYEGDFGEDLLQQHYEKHH